ncbi:MAG: FimV/HubP family polar landmark protein [Rhodanobacteraceae bacterium]
MLKIALAVSLVLGSSSALALQLGQIRVKSTLDEPLVAEIPIQLDNLSEGEGLSVSLASDADFARVGLTRPYGVDLHFNIVTDSTGHKIVLITSSQPVGDPYLDFLLQVNSRKGRQLREYTVLLDPVIASTPPAEDETSAPAPQETAAPQTIPAPAQQTPASQMTQPRPATQPQASPQPTSALPAATAAPSHARNGEYTVAHGDTLYKVATRTRTDPQVSVDQMMLALKQTNPDAFYRDNINSLRSGAILRIPTREAIDATSAAEARAQVHRQYEDWRGAAARKATVVGENTTAQSTTPSAVAEKTANTSDRLALIPPVKGGGSAASRPGQSGGSSNDTVAGLKQQLATTKEALTSAKQENNDLQSRAKQLADISGKNQKLLGMKDAQIAELQRKLAQAQQQEGKPVVASSAPAPAAGASIAAVPKAAGGTTPAATASTSAAPAIVTTAVSPAAPVATTAAVNKTVALPTPVKRALPRAGAQPGEALPWYRQPLTWVIGAIVLLALILLGLLRRPRPLSEPLDSESSLADHFGESPLARTPDDAAIEAEREDALHAQIADHPGDLDAHLALCRFYFERGNAAQFEAAAERMHEYVVDPPQPQWLDVLAMGEQLAPAHPLFATAPASAEELAAQQSREAESAGEDKYRFAFDEPPPEPVAEPGMVRGKALVPQLAVAGQDIHDDVTRQHAVPGFADEHATPEVADADTGLSASAPEADDALPFSDDPVDTKLDLARAYLDMGDPAGARAMLEEVSNEGSQMQRDEAQRLLEGLK